MSSDANKNDLQSIQSQIYEKKTSILDSTRRMLGLIDESETIGTNTAAVSWKDYLIYKRTDIFQLVFSHLRKKNALTFQLDKMHSDKK